MDKKHNITVNNEDVFVGIVLRMGAYCADLEERLRKMEQSRDNYKMRKERIGERYGELHCAARAVVGEYSRDASLDIKALGYLIDSLAEEL